MKSYSIVSILLLVSLAYMAERTVAQDSMEALMKKTVDFDAPVLDGEETLKLLKQLKEMIPKDKSDMMFDMENLINYANINSEKCTGKFDEQRQYTRTPNSLSSPNKDKLWGKNIMAYFTSIKVKAWKFCVEEFKKNVQKIKPEDAKKIDAIAKLLSPSGFKSINDLDNIKKTDVFAAVAKYVKENDKKFDEDMQKAKTREEAHKRYESDLPKVCDRYVKYIQPVSFIGKAKGEEDFPKDLFNDPVMGEWMAKWNICSTITFTKIEEFDLYYFGDKGIPVEKVPWYKRPGMGPGSAGGSSMSMSCASM